MIKISEPLDVSLYGFNTQDNGELLSSLIATYGYIGFAVVKIDYIANHTERALDLLIEEFRKDKPKLHGLIASFTNQMQDAEDTLYDLVRFRSIELASGKQLDELGVVLGLTRTSGDDDEYRADLYFQIFLNISNGEPETLIQSLQMITNAENIHYLGSYPAGVILTINQAVGSLPSNILEKMRRLKAAGVRLDLRLCNTLTPFIFDGEGTFPPVFIGEGFGETGIGWENVGGNFIELIS